jgi:hypothetical protein
MYCFVFMCERSVQLFVFVVIADLFSVVRVWMEKKFVLLKNMLCLVLSIKE